jgi:hypothetical protein
LAVVIAHFGLVLSWMGAEPLLHGAWPVQTDHAVYLSRAFQARDAWAATGRLHGWHPAIAAGAPTGTLFSASSRAVEIAVAVATRWQSAAVYSWTVVVLIALIPLACLLTIRRLGGDAWALALSATLAMLLVWSWILPWEPYLRYGMFGWPAALALAPLVVVGFASLLDRPSGKRFGITTIETVVAWLAHLSTPLLLGLGGVGAVFARRRGSLRAGLLGVALACATLVVSLFWLLPFILDLPFRVPGRSVFLSNTDRTVEKIVSHPRYRLGLAVFVLGVIGTPLLARGGSRRAAVGLASAGGAAAVIGSIGKHLPGGGELEPARYFDAAPFFFLSPASLLIVGLVRTGRWRTLSLIIAGLAVAAFPAIGGTFQVVRGDHRVIFWSDRNPDERIPAAFHELVGFFETTRGEPGRVALEDAGPAHKLGLYGAIHLPAILPWLIDRESIGGPIVSSRVLQHQVTLFDGHLMGRPLPEYDDLELRRFFDGYNVRWVVVWSPAARTDLATRPFLTGRNRFGPFELFENRLAPGFVAGQPAARISASAGSIEVHGATQSPTRLRYHCTRTMVTVPSLPIGCVAEQGLPVPFVQVENGERQDFVVRLGAGRRGGAGGRTGGRTSSARSPG